jgi:Domain of unknown function (DUF4279)
MPDNNDELTYLCGGEMDSGEIILYISSEHLQPKEITTLLGLEPTRSYCRGEVSSNGKRVYNHGGWVFSSGPLHFRSGVSCEDSIDNFMRLLPENLDIWNRIVIEHDTHVSLVLWMHTWNREFDISTFALSELSRRKLKLHVDTYFKKSDKD